uniref:DUF1902 domain-containing protein n=1 Tax=Candidatus Kentrum sp. FW TaxID=2126338 RepID=A0A450TJP7_9GAMM|nr:MAG: hypothetical protein BECKFW1821C_GA0114237_101242 [Candidatus Kentron sp. FW]
MHPKELLLRCYAENKNDQWQAFCIDINIAAQGETFEEVHGKLISMVNGYIYDATVGEHREYADQLLNRKAPLGFRTKYLWYKALFVIGRLRSDTWKLFQEAMPLAPVCSINDADSQIQTAHV